MQSLYIVYT